MYHLCILTRGDGWLGLTVKDNIGLQHNSLVFLDELRHGLPLSREGACQLLHCPDDELPAEVTASYRDRRAARDIYDELELRGFVVVRIHA